MFDLIIIGAGALGTFHAYHALRAGKKVLLLEKDHAPNEATVRNFGQVVPSGMPGGIWRRRGIESTRIYKEIQQEYDISVRANGSIYVASDPQEMGLLEELHSIMREEGYPSELWSADKCMERYPALKPTYCIAGLFFPDEITVEPDRMIHRMLDYLACYEGFRYLPNTLVRTCQSFENLVKVETALGECFEAEQVIICNGWYFKALYPELFYQSDIVVSKLNMLRTYPISIVNLPGSILTGLTIRRYESFRDCPSYVSLDNTVYDPDFFKWGIHILFKQALDGSVILGDSHEYQSARDADRLGYHIDEAINDLILREAKRIMNFPHWRIRETWAGYYAQCKGRDIFHHKIDDRIQIITAIGGKGMTGSAAYAGETIATLYASVDPVWQGLKGLS